MSFLGDNCGDGYFLVRPSRVRTLLSFGDRVTHHLSCSVLFFITVIQIILLAFSIFFFLYIFAAHFTGFSTVEFRSSRLEGL